MEELEQRKLFIGGISRETTEETLRDHFAKYGEILDCVVARERGSGTPRGFGFITLSEPSAVEKALQDTHVILERTVEVKKAIPRSQQHHNQQQNRRLNGNDRSNDKSFRTKKIFVGGLSASLTEQEFTSFFAKFGRITDVVVMHDNITSRPRGFGFITFDSEDTVEAVMQTKFYELSGKLVEVKRAVPKNDNNNNSSAYSGRMGSARAPSFHSYQVGNYPPYNYPPYSPGYGSFPGYGGVVGYVPVANFFGGPFPAGGFGGGGGGGVYVAGPWNGSVPLGGGMVAAGYNGIMGLGDGRKVIQFGANRS